jgi:hypothetical protein
MATLAEIQKDSTRISKDKLEQLKVKIRLFSKLQYRLSLD